MTTSSPSRYVAQRRRAPSSSTGRAGRPPDAPKRITTRSWSMSVSSRALADGHGHPAPVGVGAVDGGLHQRRVDDRLGHPLGLRVVAGAVDPHLDQLRGALAVAGDLAGERQGDVSQRRSNVGERRPGRRAPLARIAAVSLVEVSVSMLTALKVRSITRRNIGVEVVGVDVGVGDRRGRSAWPCRARSCRRPWRCRRSRAAPTGAGRGDLGRPCRWS